MVDALCRFVPDGDGVRCDRCDYRPVLGEPIYRACPMAPPASVATGRCRHEGRATKRIMVPCGCMAGGEVSQPTAECGLFRRCVPLYVPPSAEAWAKMPESSLYRLCHGCERFSPA